MSLAPSHEGGLPEPLALPTQSLLFRFTDGLDVGAGIVAIVDAQDAELIAPGESREVAVVFPDAPREIEFDGRRFELWLGRSVGEAEMLSVEPEARRA